MTPFPSELKPERAFGDPPPDDKAGAFANINRKIQAIEMGATQPLYFHPRIDARRHHDATRKRRGSACV